MNLSEIRHRYGTIAFLLASVVVVAVFLHISNLIVKDLIKPVIICPRDYDTLTCDDKLPYIAKNLDEFKTYLYGDVLDAHNMIPDKFTHKDEFVGDKCESTLTRTYTIYDIFGGSSSCVNKIHVKDNIPPV